MCFSIFHAQLCLKVLNGTGLAKEIYQPVMVQWIHKKILGNNRILDLSRGSISVYAGEGGVGVCKTPPSVCLEYSFYGVVNDILVFGFRFLKGRYEFL